MHKYCSYAYVALISVFIFLNIQCERVLLPVDSDDQVEYLQGNTKARIVLKAIDNHTFAPISGVKITIPGIDSVLCDSNGMAIFDSVKVGTYIVSCKKSGYESTLHNFSLVIDSNSNTVPVVNQSTGVLYIVRKGVTVKGNLYYNKNDQIHSINGATVECRSNNSLTAFEKPLAITTAKNGTYTFSDLPEYSEYTITVLPFINNENTYKQKNSISLIGKVSSDTLRAVDIVLEEYIDGHFIIMKHNLKTFTATDSIMIEFSESVDTNLIESDSINISLINASDATPMATRILTKQLWQNNNRKLIILPFDGAWTFNQEYRLTIRKIKSANGKMLDNTGFMSMIFSPNMKGELGDVKNISYRAGSNDSNKVDYNTSQITLYWSKLTCALNYQIYQKTSSDSVWTFLETVYDTFSTIQTYQEFNEGKKIKFIVLGKNSTSISSFETASILTVRDETPPRISASTYESNFDRSSNSYYGAINITIASTFLPEPMDTSGKPSITVTESSYVSGTTMYGDSLYAINSQKCSWTWISDQSGIISVEVDALKDASYDWLEIDFGSLTDLAGNRADTTLGAGNIKIQTRP